MALTTYSGLKTAIADYLDRDDLTTQIDDFIDLAEARNRKEVVKPDGTVIPPVRLREMIVRATSTLDARFIELPDGYLEAVTFRLLTSPVTVLTQIDLYDMNRFRQDTTGKPAYFTIHEEIEFDRAPDSSYTLETVYYKALDPLSDSATTNALLDTAPDVYLYGALVASAPFLMNDERIETWGTLYIQAREGLYGAAKRGRHIGPLVSRVYGATP